MPSPDPLQASARPWRNVVFALISIFVGLGVIAVALEIGVRLLKGQLTDLSSVHEFPDLLEREKLPVSYDPLLGWVPKAGARHEKDVVVTIDAQGLRSNGEGAGPASGPPLLAVGDSFTFGTEVNDHESWPAQLEVLLGRRVLNGGVSGYGFDQIVLRAEQLVPRHGPAALLVAIVGDDLERTQYAYRWAWRPYFWLSEGRLVLANVPVPEGEPPAGTYERLRGALGYSRLADLVMRRVALEWWLSGRGVLQMHREQVEVSCLLARRLAKLSRERSLPTLLVVERTAEHTEAAAAQVMECARGHGLSVLDLSPELDALVERHRGTDRDYAVRSHLSPRGNGWVAERIARALPELGAR